jgi:ABC-type multidrug transport system fused ATPase/permease subunit
LENGDEIDDLRVLYDELAHNGKRLAKDIRKSIDLYLILALIYFLLAFFSLSVVVWVFTFLPSQGITIGNIAWGVAILFTIISLPILGFGVWLVRLYYSWRGRYKGLLEMERKWSKVDG